MIREKLHAYARHVEANGGDDWVFGFVAEGHSMRKVAELTGCSSRGLLYSWIKLGGDERKRRLTEARKLSAHCVAEDAGEILDNLATSTTPISSADVSLATSRARYRQWLAGMRNREEYGDKAGVEVNITVGEMHIDALRRHSAAAIEAREAEQVAEADYEVIEDEQPTTRIAPPDERMGNELPDELHELMT